jgi:hypothetical protein
VLGHADPALTLRVYAHAHRTEDADLAFADFDAPTRSIPKRLTTRATPMPNAEGCRTVRRGGVW